MTNVKDLYFTWIVDMVCRDQISNEVSYWMLLQYLHHTEFICSMKRDVNRAADGIDLRRRFALFQGDEHLVKQLSGPCSVLEMIVALAIRCEESIMTNTEYGDRTSQWFWEMIVNLGLGGMMDKMYDEKYIDYVVTRFLNREYNPDGKGGLFTVRGCNQDLRKVEIWYQMNWYLDTL